MPLPNIILRHRWSEILPHKSLALSQSVKKSILVAGVSTTTDSQSLLADEAVCTPVPAVFSYAQLAEWPLVRAPFQTR